MHPLGTEKDWDFILNEPDKQSDLERYASKTQG